jgi:beta-phosphoglucomutase-like phosphatase (HAD superfamily)
VIPEALIFDVDGTMADTEELHRQAFNGAFARHGYNWNWSRDDYRELLRITGGKERIAHFIRTLALDTRRQDECLTEVVALHRTKTILYAHGASSGSIGLRSGIARLIGDARKRGVRLSLVTTTSPANVEALLTRTLAPEALSWFEVVVAGDMVTNKKPAPDAYLLALSRLGLSAGECVAFEDSGNGLRAASAAGIRTVVTPCQWTMGEDFSDAWLTLPELGDPQRPLPSGAAPGLSQPWLTLDDLEQVTGDAA